LQRYLPYEPADASSRVATAWGLNWPGVSGASNYVAYLQSLSYPWIYDAAVTASTNIDAFISGDGHQAVSFVVRVIGIRNHARLLRPTARSMRRMAKMVGRSDDMLMIRGVNVFPSQIEEA
jgi:hypothetical protein